MGKRLSGRKTQIPNAFLPLQLSMPENPVGGFFTLLRTYLLPQNMIPFLLSALPNNNRYHYLLVECGAHPASGPECQIELGTNYSLAKTKPKLPQNLSWGWGVEPEWRRSAGAQRRSENDRSRREAEPRVPLGLESKKGESLGLLKSKKGKAPLLEKLRFLLALSHDSKLAHMPCKSGICPPALKTPGFPWLRAPSLTAARPLFP